MCITIIYWWKAYKEKPMKKGKILTLFVYYLSISFYFSSLFLFNYIMDFILDKKKDASEINNKSFLWSPRSLQLLSNIGITETMLQNGYRHWKFETFTNSSGHGSHAATNDDHQSFRVWENEATEFNWSLSYECNKVCDALINALAGLGVKVDYQHELIKLDDFYSDDVFHSHYHHNSQQKKNPIIMATILNHNNENNGSIEYFWKSKFVIGADGKNSFVRHKLGNKHNIYI